MDHRYCAENDNILIRPLNIDDIEKLRIWRNDSSLSTFLQDVPYITPQMQCQWYEKYLQEKDILFFAVVDKSQNNMVGTVALYGFKNKQCEVGKIVVGDTSAHGKGIGYELLLLAMAIAVKELSVEKMVLNVHEANIPARSVYEKVGFKVVGRHAFAKGGSELEMEVTSQTYYKNNAMVKEIRIYKGSM